MKRKFLFIAALPVILLFSCKKDNSTGTPTNNDETSKIKTWTGNSYVTTYSYDASGRRILAAYSSGAKTTYDYPIGKVIQKQFNTAGVNDFTYNYELGSDGLVITESRPQFPGFSSTRVYNNEKQVVKIITNINGQAQTSDYFYSNGNCDSTRFTSNGNWTSSVKYTYYTDKLNTLSNDTEGVPFFGKDSKNLLKTEQYIYPDGSTNSVVTNTYEFDAKGRVIKETSANGANLDISYITFF